MMLLSLELWFVSAMVMEILAPSFSKALGALRDSSQSGAVGASRACRFTD
ncbi:hypothetical protein F2Q69_00062576 [Brassica cretica]|uniref:Uncharacterized protein n=1 Tax=Brassica cretica TaxID=69181 RepID=A0A8S9RL41_BRACR|nr:hypothetical protein F2Q69_00062576 [Brassica cretica]